MVQHARPHGAHTSGNTNCIITESTPHHENRKFVLAACNSCPESHEQDRAQKVVHDVPYTWDMFVSKRRARGKMVGEVRKQETERHTQGTEPTQQHNTHTHSTIQNKPDGNPRQRHKTAKQAGKNKGRRAQARHGGTRQTPAPEPAKTRLQGGTRPTSAGGGRATGHCNA
jgi:hypothetical protein